MAKKIYVGNLSYQTTDEGLRNFFASYGEVDSVAIITDRDSGRSKGFGFVEMRNDEDAKNAIASLDGTELDGRRLRVNEANEKPRRDAPRW